MCGVLAFAPTLATRAPSVTRTSERLAIELPIVNSGDTTATLLTITSATCSDFQRFVPQLRRLDADARESGRKLIVVSSGDPDRNRELALHATILLDQTFSWGNRLGVRGTPSAVLLGRDGMPIGPAVGERQIMSLASSDAFSGGHQHEVAVSA